MRIENRNFDIKFCGRVHVGARGVVVRIILKRVFKKECVRLSTGLI